MNVVIPSEAEGPSPEPHQPSHLGFGSYGSPALPSIKATTNNDKRAFYRAFCLHGFLTKAGVQSSPPLLRGLIHNRSHIWQSRRNLTK